MEFPRRMSLVIVRLGGLLGVAYACFAGAADPNKVLSLAAAPLSAEAIERMARVVTELDPRINTLEIRGQLASLGDTGSTAQRLFRYKSPDKYILFTSRTEEEPAYMAMAQERAVIYDVERGAILLLDGAVPKVSLTLENNDPLVAWGFVGSEKSTKPAPKVMLDFPALLTRTKTGTREVEDLGGGSLSFDRHQHIG